MQVCPIWVIKFHASGDKLVVEGYWKIILLHVCHFNNQPASPMGLCLPCWEKNRGSVSEEHLIRQLFIFLLFILNISHPPFECLLPLGV